MQKNSRLILYMRNMIFGAEDSLVSTVGLLSGIAVAGVANATIVLTGIVLIFVEAFSMAVGSYLSEYEVEEFSEGARFKKAGATKAAGIMFASYLLSGLIPLWPYLFIENFSPLLVSIASSMVGLFLLGYFSAEILKIRIFKSAIRMTLIGGLAILLGVVVGKLLGT